MEKECDCLFKVALAGDLCVGKTWSFEKFDFRTFSKFHRATARLDTKIRMVDLDGLKIKFEIWNSIKTDEFWSLRRWMYIDFQGYIFVFDINNAESFLYLPKFIKSLEILAFKPKSVFIVGNKLDLGVPREVSYEEAKMFADRNGMNYIEVSALTGHNIEALFRLMAMEIVSQSPGFIKILNTLNLYKFFYMHRFKKE